ncbi:fumarylacetoacetate hydrolase domain-containing protein 2-like [Elysia marginata]|uniref:Fumarylacetoacetate hydrolase domain-containing protein 2-like n=1 Tax=Elysia marginata TaxID=1093978 RepID=A0AAV4GHJ2_9GAST|nr:fumarylacetoacetate hydrolase domain-containing protein 2-like [Elysia marginata]
MSLVFGFRQLLRPAAAVKASRFFRGTFLSQVQLAQFHIPHDLSTGKHFLSTMRFVRYETSGRLGLGVELSENGNVVDLTSYDPTVGTSMQGFIEGGQESLLKAKKAIDSGKNILQRDQIKLLAPITDPGKILCIGMNYRDHCEEQNLPVPQEPVVFSKFNSAIIGPTDSIKYPSETEELDWEVELVIVIGKEAKNVPVGHSCTVLIAENKDDLQKLLNIVEEESRKKGLELNSKKTEVMEKEAMNYVFGYTVAHDVSARVWQLHRNGGQFLIGKSMDCFCPLGPAIVAKEDLKDPHNLRLWTLVNGVTKQEGNTNAMVFKTEAVIAFLTRFMTLKPGDIILTGTPPGVGVFKNPPEFLKRGDVVEVGVEGIGSIMNKIE